MRRRCSAFRSRKTPTLEDLLDWATGTPTFQQRDDGVYMVEARAWPERILIAEELLRDGRTDIMDFSSFRHLRIRVTNGQAIYRLVWRSWRRTFAGELVYAEIEPHGGWLTPGRAGT